MPIDGSADHVIAAATASVELEASGATIDVHVHGTSYFEGPAALRQAAEVRALVALLERAGVASDAVTVRDVRVSGAGRGLFGTSTSASYTLAVRIDRLDAMGDVLGAIAAHGASRTGSIEWRFPDEHAAEVECLRRAAARTRAAASAMAAGVGRALGRAVQVREPSVAPVRPEVPPHYMAMGAAAAPQRAELGAEICRTRTITRTVEVTYRLGDDDAAY